MKDGFIPYQKLQKKRQRAIDRQKRVTWGEINPVTRYDRREGAYDRKQENRRWTTEARRGSEESGGILLLSFML